MNASRITALLTLAMLTTLLPSAPACAQQKKLAATTLTIGMHLVRAEVAVNDEERSTGLMYRREMGANEGMVFRFPNPKQVCMWMKNTYLPLSVAFLDEDGKIINIEDMQPETEIAHCAKRTARYALEMNQGWFRKKNIKPGSTIEGLPK
jgi:uncharacterized membrane protein (UPF0127 family)